MTGPILSERWSRTDLILLGILMVVSGVILCTGLSTRSLWGPEGRWAVITREMISSGNYFLPSLDGKAYFDKPLLSYWLILPFAWKAGVTEAVLRIPSVLAGIGTVLLVYVIGRKLFGSLAGVVAATLLLASVQYVFWSRTASAELLNLFAIWFMLWAYLAGGFEGRLAYLLLFYGTGAVASFLKGPVAPAVALSVVGLCSFAGVLRELRQKPLDGGAVKEAIRAEFRWIICGKAWFAMSIGAALFAALLLMPVLFSGSWDPVHLMWKENFMRFFQPFDHVEPPYTYLKYILLFSAPWTFFMLASLAEARRWRSEETFRWILLAALAIYLFFTASGSRRSYYILPLVPALALISGKVLADWIKERGAGRRRTLSVAAILTSGVVGLTGVGLSYAYLLTELPRTASQLLLSVFLLAGGVFSVSLFLKNKPARGLLVLLPLVLILEFWMVSVGLGMAEQNRTLRPFAREAARKLHEVSAENIALFQGANSSLVFYLNRGNMKIVNTRRDIEGFKREHPDGFLIGDLTEMRRIWPEDYLENLIVVILQRGDMGDKEERFALLRFRSVEAAGSTASTPPG